MAHELELSRADLHVLFWIMSCVRGASLQEIIDHEQHRRNNPPSVDAIGQCIARLTARRLITLDGDRYHGDAQLQRDFLTQCQNCRDTVEEVDILRRIIPNPSS